MSEGRSVHATDAFVVLKFGGSSVSSKETWDSIFDVLTQRSREFRPFVVCSALSGISDALERLAAKSAGGKDYHELLEYIVQRHRDVADDLGVDFDSVIGSLLSDLEKLIPWCRIDQ